MGSQLYIFLDIEYYEALKLALVDIRCLIIPLEFLLKYDNIDECLWGFRAMYC
jgi:hypothetical protein